MLTKVMSSSLIFGMSLLTACNIMQGGEPTPISPYVVIPFTELELEELNQEILNDPGLPGCRLSDLPPFGWKEVDSGMVDIRTPLDYALRVGSLYQEGYRNYLENRIDFPDTYQSIPEMSYEEFLAICNVFPEVDFSQYSVLGNHGVGSGCTVTFEKAVLIDDKDKSYLYQLTIHEAGACEKTSNDRNLILVPRIPEDYKVIFSQSSQKE